MTLGLILVLVLIICFVWSLFISGPVRVNEQNEATIIAKIEKKNKDIQGITKHTFDYVTYQGYDDNNLYWYDAKGNLIIKKKIKTLDYDKAKKVAKKDYGIKCDTIELGYGYDNPVYEIHGSKKMILLDYDTLARVYERQDNNG